MITYNCSAVDEQLMLITMMQIDEEEKSEPVLDQETIDYAFRVFLPVVVTIGLIGNFLNVLVFTSQRMRMPSGFHLTLLGIALADSGVLICCIFDIVQRSEEIEVEAFSLDNKILELVKYPLQNVFKHISILLLVLSAFMRFIGVKYPFNAACWFTKCRTSISIVAIVLFCLLCNVPRVFETHLLVCPMEEQGVDFTLMVRSEIGNSFTYKTVFPWLSSTIFFFVPFTLLLIFHLILLSDIWNQKVIRHQLSNKKSLTTSQCKTNTKIQINETQITVMIIVVITLFLILESPTAIIDALNEGSVRISAASTRKGVLELANLASILNCIVNIFIYLVFSRQYRQAFVAAILCHNLRFRPGRSTIASPVTSRTSRLSSDEVSRNSRLKQYELEKIKPSEEQKLTPDSF